MDQIEIELIELLNNLNDIKSFSIQTIKPLKSLLERYDAIIERLLDLDQNIYSKSMQKICFIESKINMLTSKGAPIALKRVCFIKARQSLLRSLQDDLRTYRNSGNEKDIHLILIRANEHNPIALDH